ncbi:MAG TPA: DUF4232 domain-containing protein [Candidatus Limnocylindrales bacterium]
MDDFDERLSRRLRALDAAVPAASADVPGIGRTRIKIGRSGAQVAGRLPLGLTAVLVAMMVVAVAGVGLYYRGETAPPGPDAQGIPTQIDGQRVYRVGEQSEWENLSGSFLLATTPSLSVMGCPPGAYSPQPERDLLSGPCGGVMLGSITGAPLDLSDILYAAAKGLPYSWLGDWSGHTVILRAHTHDPEAAQCLADTRARCDASVVVEAVVWPTVPTEIGGAPVYRGHALAATFSSGTFKDLGSFLYGGVVDAYRVHWEPGFCATPVAQTQAEQQAEQELVSGCDSPTVLIDMQNIAPDSNFDPIDGQLVVVRAHVNDAVAAQCPADAQRQCETAIVVDSVVWSSNPYRSATPTPTVASASPTTEPSPTDTASSAESVGPADIQPCQASSLAIDGVRQGESGIVNLGIVITNTGDVSCMLPQLPAAVQLLDAKGTALDIPTETTTATPGPPAPPVVIAPHVAAAAILTVYWISWCQPDPGPLTVKVTFVAGAGSVSGPVGPGGPLPRCDTPGRASSLQLDGINAAS